MSKFREILNDGDLILQVRVNKGLGKYSWESYRNLSEEVRLLDSLKEEAKREYQKLEELYKIANANVSYKRKVLQEWSKYNTDIPLTLENEPSILDRMDGVNYEQAKKNANSNKNQQNSNKSSSGDNKSGNNGASASNKGGNNSGRTNNNGGSIPLIQLLANATVPASVGRA